MEDRRTKRIMGFIDERKTGANKRLAAIGGAFSSF